MKDNDPILYKTPELGHNVTAYAEQHSTALPRHISEYNATISSTREDSLYMSSNFQSQFNVLLAKSIGAKRVLEIGVYVGYSAMGWAHAVGRDGVVTGLEYSAEYARLAQEAFAANDISNVDVIVGAAAETLPNLNPRVPFDLVFIDADKTGYPGYLKQLLEGSQPGSVQRLLRPGALIVSDNVLHRGLVADDKALGDGELTRERLRNVTAVREFNELCVSNARLETFVVPLWDGVSITRLID